MSNGIEYTVQIWRPGTGFFLDSAHQTEVQAEAREAELVSAGHQTRIDWRHSSPRAVARRSRLSRMTSDQVSADSFQLAKLGLTRD